MKQAIYLGAVVLSSLFANTAKADAVPAVPDTAQLQRPFDEQDLQMFKSPAKCFYPETWFHFIRGNVDKNGITEDLQAIANAGLAGVQLFHGMGDDVEWKGVKEPIYCLSEKWDALVTHAASEAHRLGLRFTMQNCPGWAMSGGPWIDLDHCMRHLAKSTTSVMGGKTVKIQLPQPKGNAGEFDDYRDITVLAFPTPLGDSDKPLFGSNYYLEPTTPDKPHVIDIQLADTATARSLVFSSIDSFNHDHCVDPDINFWMNAIDAKGQEHEILHTKMPDANWQDDPSITFSLSEFPGVSHYRLYITNKYIMDIDSLSLYTSARQTDWEGDAGWTNRTLMSDNFTAKQSQKCYINPDEVLDVSSCMDADGNLNWNAPKGNWTIMRIGHVNTGKKNGPAPEEATGWECSKFDTSAADLHFNSYIGRLANGPLKGTLNNMLMDSWECKTQTWSTTMPEDFKRIAGYELTKWIPAIFGYVMGNPETTSRFLYDWRHTLNSLYVNNYFGRMANNAHKNGLTIAYETAAGDITPADCMEYYKWADVPMCEFWQPFHQFLANHNYKPIRPTASAAHMYGKPRVSAEAFTSFHLTWNEHLQMLKDVANQNLCEGVTHLVFHTYTHNPDATHYYPGTSFGSGIGSPFLRSQTWWKHMPAFTTYLARCAYMLERGKPVADILWYLGDEPQQKPRQDGYFPEGYHYDYCNQDALLNRLDVKDGKWVTPDGIAYSLFWIPERGRMTPETLERLCTLVKKGGVLVADEPTDLATLNNSNNEQARYATAIEELWQKEDSNNVRHFGKGKVIKGTSLENALSLLNIQQDVQGASDRWLHRKADGADWYFVCSDEEKTLNADVTFNNMGEVSVWNPVTGDVSYPTYKAEEGKTSLHLDLPVGGNCFVLFAHNSALTTPNSSTDRTETVSTDISNNTWNVQFPAGWGIDEPIKTNELKPWRELVASEEGKAFSGTATYSTIVKMKRLDKDSRYVLQLGKVEMIAVVRVNGQEVGTTWTEPYEADITQYLHKGNNKVEIDVTSTWFNRLAYDANQPENERKTWCIHGPDKNSALLDYGLMGPVRVSQQK